MSDRSTSPARRFAVLATGAILAASTLLPANAEPIFELSLQETGKRDYYCTATFALTAQRSEPFQEVNGFFHAFVDDDQVGRTRAASFRFDEGQMSSTAVFESPDLPCEAINGYAFVVGACLRDRRFIDLTECAAEIAPVPPVNDVTAR
ncbi:hypothetical protein [Bauldia sp.]|uniref:hypothetical protein n=1 Tax=Bauldia sp. TaxID=2575872 RepID=UPI003BA8E93B